MVSNLGDNYNCNLLEATELNNFRFFTQSCSQVGPVTLDNSPSNTTSGYSDDDTDDVHQWISNYFNSTYTGTEGDNRGEVGGVSNYDNENYDNEEYNEEEYDGDNSVLQRRSKRTKKGDNGKGKEAKTITCYTCGKQGHTSTRCYYNKGKSGKVQNKGQPQSSYYSQQLEKAIHNHHLINNKTTLNRRRHNIHLLHLRGGKKRQQVPGHQINDNDYYFEEDPYAWDTSWSQEWYPEGDANPQRSGQEVGQVLQQQSSGDTSSSSQTMGSLYEIESVKAVGYNGYITAATTATMVPMTFILTDNHLDTRRTFGQSSLTQELQSVFAQ
eukprot:5681931-Amphidinium_carterae.1